MRGGPKQLEEHDEGQKHLANVGSRFLQKDQWCWECKRIWKQPKDHNKCPVHGKDLEVMSFPKADWEIWSQRQLELQEENCKKSKF